MSCALLQASLLYPAPSRILLAFVDVLLADAALGHDKSCPYIITLSARSGIKSPLSHAERGLDAGG
jgi:hypothetical protein